VDEVTVTTEMNMQGPLIQSNFIGSNSMQETDFREGITVSGAAYLEGGIQQSAVNDIDNYLGGTTVIKDLIVTGSMDMQVPVEYNGPIDQGGYIGTDRNFLIGSDMVSLTVLANAEVNGGLNVGGNTEINGSLDVDVTSIGYTNDYYARFGAVSNNNNYWKNPLGLKIINSIIDLNNGNIKSTIDNFRSIIIDITYKKISYKEKREKLKELKGDYNLNAKLNKLLIEIADFNIILAEWTKKTTEKLSDFFELTSPLDLELKKGSFSPNHKILMSDLFLEKKMKWNFPISTIHKVKGMTLDTTLLFLHKNRHSISLADITPSNGDLTENQTMIYVAMSRPRYLLAIAIENTVGTNKIIEKLGNNIKII
jgi:hypothetical protein